MKFVLDRSRHPFYDHSDAEFFIALDGKTTLGRLAAIKNNRYNEFNQSKTGFFYYFESIDSVGVSNALFDQAFQWARDQGLQDIYGPKGPLQGDSIGILVDGFEYLPAMGIAYNYPYYDNLVKSAGFEKEFDYFSARLTFIDDVSEKVKRISEKVKERRGFSVKKFTSKDELLAITEELRQVYNLAFGGSEGFSPITKAEIKVIAERLTSIADPRLIKLVYKDDQIIGFLFAYPNISKGLQRAGGKLFPLGWFHIWRAFKTTRYMEANGIGIHPDYQGLGATAVLYTELAESMKEFNFDHVETVQTREDNLASLGESSHFESEWYKTHRVYRKKL
jgi:GNAT superfamily N-acetyltransferase